jgi:serine/threonine protein kinase
MRRPWYLQAVEAGEVPNREDLLAQHPALAEPLRAFFADLDRMDRVASPLRQAAEAEGTAALDGAAEPTTVRYFGDYELLEEIARGGMGVVYKARQASLNRVVALKMILAGAFATPRDVQRFRTEAEAAANLDHPNIVPIFEVGEHEGQQYYSMKLVDGGPLSKQPRGDDRSEVRGLVAVARAVHHAHQHGVLHRDLKPSNVLVDPEGTYYVTDFGLAKRLADADRSLTETGQVIGTPRYMAPEQAAGRKDLTVAADVYSLGVLLYDRLAGRPPFTADSPLELLRQIRDDAPPRPTTLRPDLPRDLETILLKCLDKDPSRRYDSASSLADDLDRWLTGSPISARPVGPLERTWLWARRNPTLSISGSLAVAGLLAATVFSIAFALQFRARARIESAARKAADEARDSLEGTLARSLVGPLQDETDGSEVLSEPEANALWQLAQQPDNGLRYRFLVEGMSGPLSSRQLRTCSEQSLIAVVGLDPSKRSWAARLMTDRLHDSNLSLDHKADVALLALELEDQDNGSTREYADIVIEALAEKRHESPETGWSWHLIRSSGRLEPKSACRLLSAAVMVQREMEKPGLGDKW